MNTAPSLRRSVGGLESEIAFVATDRHSGRRLDSARGTVRLIELAKSRLPHLPISHRSLGIMLSSGAVLYQDAAQGGAHPELATPESLDPKSVIIDREAGYRLLKTVTESDPDFDWRFFRNNVDGFTGASWATHFSCETSAPLESITSSFLPFIASKIIFAGSGGFTETGEFCLAPRLQKFRAAVSADTEGGSTAGRPLVCSRERSPVNGLRRQEFISHESLRSHLAGYLDIAATWLVMHLVNQGRRPERGVELKNPVAALKVFNADPSAIRAKAVLAAGEASGIGAKKGAVTALELQRHYLDAVGACLGEPWMPDWAAGAIRIWQETLDLIALGPEATADRLDWSMKLAILRSAMPGSGAIQASPEMREMDCRFSEVGTGIFDSLDLAGAIPGHRIPGIDEAAIRSAMETPPEGTRAMPRGKWVAALASESRGGRYFASWDGIEDRQELRFLDFRDPLATEVKEWSSSGLDRLDWSSRVSDRIRPHSPRREAGLTGHRDDTLAQYTRGNYNEVISRFQAAGEAAHTELHRNAAWAFARAGYGPEAIVILENLRRSPVLDSITVLDDSLLVHRFLQIRPEGETVEALVDQALYFFRSEPDRVRHRLRVNLAGIWLRSPGNAAKADEMLEGSGGDRPPLPEERIEVRRLVELAEAKRQRNCHLGGCLSLLERASSAQRANGWMADLADFTLPTLARFQASNGRRREAREALAEALEIQNRLGSPMTETRSLLMSWRLLDGGRPPENQIVRYAELKTRFPWLCDDPTVVRIEGLWEEWLSGEADPEGGGGSDCFWFV